MQQRAVIPKSVKAIFVLAWAEIPRTWHRLASDTIGVILLSTWCSNMDEARHTVPQENRKASLYVHGNLTEKRPACCIATYITGCVGFALQILQSCFQVHTLQQVFCSTLYTWAQPVAVKIEARDQRAPATKSDSKKNGCDCVCSLYLSLLSAAEVELCFKQHSRVWPGTTSFHHW